MRPTPGRLKQCAIALFTAFIAEWATGSSSIFVGCNAWLVEADNDPVFEDAHKVRQLRKWPYEQLLKDIQTQLGE